MPQRKRTPEDFWARVDKSGDCWIWTGARNQFGAKLVGKTWTLTPRAVERYRATSLGKRGRRAKEKG